MPVREGRNNEAAIEVDLGMVTEIHIRPDIRELKETSSGSGSSRLEIHFGIAVAGEQNTKVREAIAVG